MTTAEPLSMVELTLACRALDDTEKLRVSMESRLRILTNDKPDKDGVVRGFGLPETYPTVVTVKAVLKIIGEAENMQTREIERMMRKHALAPWIMAQKGVGMKQAARLLAAVGDPYWNTLDDRPRTVAELWAYCGLVPGQKRRKGQKSNWSADAKSRAWLISQSILKSGGPWREVWDQRRAHTAGRVHPEPCARCGPEGHPAPAGSPWSLGHAKGDADRYVAKRLLRELWREARRLHGVADDEDGITAYAA